MPEHGASDTPPGRFAVAGRGSDPARPLDWLNFLLADVQGGLGPFLAIYLMGTRHWNAGTAGLVLTVGGLATVAAQGPLGALVDRVRWKRAIVVAGALVVAASATSMATWPGFWPVTLASAASGIADAAFPASVAAISLGIVGRAAFARRIGRNEAFNHVGNVGAAVLTGLAGWRLGPVWMLWLVAAVSLASMAAALAIDPARIDHRVACGADADAQPAPRGGLARMSGFRQLVFFAAAVTLFHFANAAMLPLLGEKLAMSHEGAGALFMASCIVTAQVVMVPMAILVGRRADRWGRKPIFLAGLLVLPLRGVLYTLTNDPFMLVAIQVLDGVGAGIFGALFPVVVADLTRGTGHYNLARGAVATSWGLGAALSNGVAGYVVVAAGYNAAFLFLGACALAAPLVYALAVPETRNWMPEAGKVEAGAHAGA